ncbi:hypothetical protein NDU88_006733 [Pleurodeles waltl]|uniref:Uncharacterized protein n=1 Tax=Pleurodeles waltl TaxID=8319 RepID=A0AAV7SQH9_PLEWA|nr:hypothetical protein NDU88_006733 [Pleurodeles waltl]
MTGPFRCYKNSLRADRREMEAEGFVPKLCGSPRSVHHPRPTTAVIHLWRAESRRLGWERRQPVEIPLWKPDALAELQTLEGKRQWDLIEFTKLGDWGVPDLRSFEEL